MVQGNEIARFPVFHYMSLAVGKLMLKPFRNGGLRMVALELCQNLSVLEELDGGDTPDSENTRKFRVLIHVDFDQVPSSCGLCYQCFKRGDQHLAWTTPGRPEVNQHRCGFTGLDNVSL